MPLTAWAVGTCEGTSWRYPETTHLILHKARRTGSRLDKYINSPLSYSRRNSGQHGEHDYPAASETSLTSGRPLTLLSLRTIYKMRLSQSTYFTG